MPSAQPRLRVAFVLPGAWPRPIGALKVIYGHADRLASRGHQVTLVHPWQPEPGRSPGALPDPHPWFSFRTREVRSLLVPSLAERWIGGRFDVVVATAWQTVAAVGSYSPRLGRKAYFLQDHESYLLGNPAIQAAMVRTLTVPWPLIVNSEPVERLVESVAGRRCHRIPCAIDTSTFGLDIPVDGEERLLVGFPARSEQAKRTGDAVRALRLVRSAARAGETIGGLDVWCFGSYPRAALPPWITHHPAPSDAELRRLYNHTAVFIVPSLHEGFGLPGAEAMACGAALVSTCNGGVNAYARHAESAWLSPVGDPEALATSAIRLLGDSSLRCRIARAGVSSVGRQSCDDAASALEAVLQRVVNGGDGTNDRPARGCDALP